MGNFLLDSWANSRYTNIRNPVNPNTAPEAHLNDTE